MIKTLFSAVTGALDGVWGYVAALGIGAIVAGAGIGWTIHKIDQAAYLSLQLADQKAQAAAVKDAIAKRAAIDSGNQKDAVAEAYFRGQLDGTIVNLKTEGPSNVTITQDQEAAASDHAGCITFGFERMLVAGERGVPADSLVIPGGQSVDACTADEPSDLAARLAQDLAAGFANSHQLDALIAAVKRNDAIATAPADSPAN